MPYAKRKDDAREPALFPEGRKRQLDFVKDLTREEMILASAPQIAETANALLADAEFDWNTNHAVILKEQRATADYSNKSGELIMRRGATWEGTDTFVYVSPENIIAFLESAAKRARE